MLKFIRMMKRFFFESLNRARKFLALDLHDIPYIHVLETTHTLVHDLSTEPIVFAALELQHHAESITHPTSNSFSSTKHSPSPLKQGPVPVLISLQTTDSYRNKYQSEVNPADMLPSSDSILPPFLEKDLPIAISTKPNQVKLVSPGYSH